MSPKSADEEALSLTLPSNSFSSSTKDNAAGSEKELCLSYHGNLPCECNVSALLVKDSEQNSVVQFDGELLKEISHVDENSSNKTIKISDVPFPGLSKNEEDNMSKEHNHSIETRKFFEFDILSRDNTTSHKQTSVRVEESSSDETIHDLELRLSSPKFKKVRIKGAEIIQPVEPFQPEDPDHWTIKKVLTKSDVNGSARLLLGRKQVLTHIMPFLTDNPSEFFKSRKGIKVTVYDVDTRREYMMTLKKWSTDSFLLLDKWTRDFVKRRGLKENDEVGLRWDVTTSRFEFKLLKKYQPEY